MAAKQLDAPRGEGSERWRNRGQCGYQGCQHTALVKQWTITGWLPLCELCYARFHADNHDKIPKRVTQNPVCDEIRKQRRIK